MKKGGKGSCPWGVSRGVGKGVGAHGVCEEGWEREFLPMGGKKGGKGISHPWGEVKRGGKGISHPVRAHGVCQVKKKPQPLWNGWGFF